MNFSARMIRKVSLKPDLFLVFFVEKILCVTMAPESIVDLMCLEIFPAEVSDLRAVLHRKQGLSDTLIGISIFYSLPVVACVDAETTSGSAE